MLQKILVTTLDNLFDLATIVVAAILVVRYQLTPPLQQDVPDIIVGILAVLGLMAVSGLWERNRKLKRMERAIQETKEMVQQHLSDVVPAQKFFIQQKLHQLPDTIFEHATTIDIGGIVLGRTIREYTEVLRRRLRAGAEIRIMICDPDNSEVTHQMTLRLEEGFTADYWKERLESTLLYIKSIATSSASVGENRVSQGSIKAGLLSFIPSFGMICLDRDSPHGVCYVEIYHHKSLSYGPAFVIYKEDDPVWYQFFVRQFDKLWNSARILSV